MMRAMAAVSRSNSSARPVAVHDNGAVRPTQPEARSSLSGAAVLMVITLPPLRMPTSMRSPSSAASRATAASASSRRRRSTAVAPMANRRVPMR